MDRRSTHDLIQDFLEGVLSPAEARAFEARLETDMELRSEVESWRSFFSELGSLPEAGPTTGFDDRVMSKLELGMELVSEKADVAVTRRSGFLNLFRSKRRSGVDLTSPELIQDYLDGTLSRGLAARVKARLGEDEAVGGAIGSWKPVFASLAELGHVSPPATFADRVMAQVPVRKPALIVDTGVQGMFGRLVRSLRRLGADRRRSWAVAAGVGLTPVITFSVLAYESFTSPTARPADLFAYLQMKLATVGTVLSGFLGDSATAIGAGPAIEFFQTSAGILPAMGLGFAVLFLGSLWVLYRNLISGRPVDVHYVQLSL